ncbi:RTA1-domain-containing protein [Meira miltonrushii]|uniref:RTA1-domain-containing protein n=1 Tax=Meira miltonrushii TaxID=1280837 RepID=A0A316V4N9_9BASI|nr:RTA1-domain-containing protein [Meira miltonrushii]PWN32224.1 RTA1-domain-containing protein [Meira miltonrushii]
MIGSRLSTSTVVLVALTAPTLVKAVELQPDSYLDYVPNLAGNAIFGVLYSVLCLVLFYHTLFLQRKPQKWALTLPIGTFFAALGYWLRIPMRTSQHNESLYTVMYLFVVLSPAAFLAFNYIAFGRLTAALEGERPSNVKRKSQYLFIPPRWVKIIFVTSDVCTFCVQAAGGGMQTSNDYQTANTGNNVFLAGVSAQGASYLLFTALILVAHYRLIFKRPDGHRFNIFNFSEPTVIMLDLLYISSIGILVRSVYRIIEMAQGYGGYLYTHEIFTFTLDALPLVIAIGVWALYWPGLLIRKVREEAAAPSQDLEQGTNDASNSPTESPSPTAEKSETAN